MVMVLSCLLVLNVLLCLALYTLVTPQIALDRSAPGVSGPDAVARGRREHTWTVLWLRLLDSPVFLPPQAETPRRHLSA